MIVHLTSARIDTEADLTRGAQGLLSVAPQFAPVLDLGPLPLRRRADGFPALLHAIVGQQVSTAAAAAIWGRVETLGLTDPAVLAQAPTEDLVAAGLSRPKQRYARALAEAGLDYAALRQAPAEDVIAILVAQPGIGRWTAEVYAVFALGHADVLPAGDLALQEAARVLFDLDARPSEKALRTLGADWAPWRAVAARALWAYYRHLKGREGIG